MNLTAQHPNPQDWLVFLRDIVETLRQLHAEQRAHGAIAGATLQDWLTPDGDALDEERFKASAKPADQLPENAIQADVHAFVTVSIRLIEGEKGAPDQPFQPDLHQGKGWPLVFLRLLAKVQEAGPSSCVTMADLSQTLDPSASSGDTSQPAAETEPAVLPKPAVHHDTSPAPTKPAPTTPAPQPQINVALRNATVGKPYEVEPGAIAKAIAKQRGDAPDQARISHLQLPEDCGLTFDGVTGAVTGIPTRAFEGALHLDYVPSRSASSISFTVRLLINPDPASLWKDLPPPADAPYPKQDTAHSEQEAGPFRVIAASRRGRSHANKGEFRDDDYAIGFAPATGWLVVVVADGAGSAKYARRGSQIACETAKARLVTVLGSAEHNRAEALYRQHRDWQRPDVQTALRRILYEAALSAHYELRNEVKQPAAPLPAPPTLRNYDTTLILLVIKKADEGWLAATFAIGDGGAGFLPHPGSGFPLTHPEGGEHAGQTTFLTLPGTVRDDEASLASHFQFALQPEFAGALVMTDGITDPKFPSETAFADPARWAALWEELQPVLPDSSAALLDWMNFFSPGNHDDRTLVAVLPAPATQP